jgi:hypothetical protein
MTMPHETSPSRIDFARFFELAVDVFVVTGPNGRFELVNAALPRLLGVSRETILSQPWSAFVHPDDRERSAAEAAREFGHGHRTITFENRYVDASGGVHWMDWSAELDPDTGLVYGIARDVTEQRAAREALEAARETAERANRAKSEFLSRMSHELRTPLNAILGFSQVLEMDGLDEAQQEHVDQITAAGRHLLELIDEVLDISRIEIGAVSISVEPVRVGDPVAEAMSLVGPIAAGRRTRVRSIVSDPDVHVMADRQRLRQVLVNFLSNAIKYAPPDSHVEIASTPVDDGWLRIVVIDDGPGIRDELLPRLFSPFDRIGAETTTVEGTGLGLAHSRAMAERMGGRVGASSRVGEGSSFWIELPVIAAPAAAERDERLRDSVPATATAGTVLYIEDNASNVRLVAAALGHRPGVRFLSAARGQLGLEIAQEHRPELVVLDLHLPDLPGQVVLERLRADPRTVDIPVLILSADATRTHVDLLLRAGAQAYLTKPFAVVDLLTLVDRHLGRPGSAPAEEP